VEVCAQCHSFGAWRDEEQYRRSGVPYRAGEDLGVHRATLRHAQVGAEPVLVEMLAGDSLAVEGRFWGDGTNRVAGREYNGLLESSHADTELTCLSCHSMHTYADPADQLQAEVTEDQTCVGCHDDLSADVASHTRHQPGSSGSACMNCHMPRTTYGLFAAMRSHRIDSPSVRVSVESGKPNACNLCHLDRTLEWTGRYLTEWYEQPAVELDDDHREIAAGALWSLKGDAALRTIVGWHLGWAPAREASGDTWIAPYLAQLLADPYSATRRVAHRSIATLPGFEGFRYDYVGAPDALGRKADEAMERWRRQLGASVAHPEVLMGPDGGIQLEIWLRLLSERDQRPLTIRE
jgi:predicted CXXCH cytochrome family protein